MKEAPTSIDTQGILTKNPFRYRGYYYDTETGFYNLNARYYDPQVRRFISADSMSLLMINTASVNCKNLFAYCENDPVNSKDSNGTIIETVFDVVTLGISIVDVFMHPKDPWAWACLAGDAVDLIPFVTCVGEGVKGLRIAKMAGKVDDVGDGLKLLSKADDVADSVRLISKTDDVVDAAKCLRKADDSSDIVKSLGEVSKRQTPDQKALNDLAKELERNAKRGKYISYEEAKILDEWAIEYNVPRHHSSGDSKHSKGCNYMDHTHIYKIHIPYEHR